MAAGEIVTADLLPSESAIFIVAQQLGHLAAGLEIERLVGAGALPAEAVAIAEDSLAAYFGIGMPRLPAHRLRAAAHPARASA